MEAGRIYHRQARVLSLEEHGQEIDAVVAAAPDSLIRSKFF